MKHNYKSILINSLIITVLTMAALFLFVTVTQTVAPAMEVKSASVQTYQRDPSLVAVMDDLNLDYSDLNLIYVSFEGQAGEIAGMYVSDGLTKTVQVRYGLSAEALPELLSHEYLHYIQHTKPVEATLYRSQLYALYAKNAELQRRVGPYKTGAVCQNTATSCDDWKELQAYACTELPDYELPAELLSFCNKYLPNRSDLIYDKSDIYLN